MELLPSGEWCDSDPARRNAVDCPKYSKYPSNGRLTQCGYDGALGTCSMRAGKPCKMDRSPSPPPPVPSSSQFRVESARLHSCSTSMSNTFPGPVQLLPPSDCSGSRFLTVGSYGSRIKCQRTFEIFVMRFKLPSFMDKGTVEEASLDLFVAQMINGGVTVRLDGLGTQPGDEQLAVASQSPDDYFVGPGDPTDDAVSIKQITTQMLPERWGAPKPFNYTSAALTSYIQEQVDAGAAGKFLVLRLSATNDNGCFGSCSKYCPVRRYRFFRTSEALNLKIRVPTTAGVRSAPEEGDPSPSFDPDALSPEWEEELQELDKLDDEDEPQQAWLVSSAGVAVSVGVALFAAAVCILTAPFIAFRVCQGRWTFRTAATHPKTNAAAAPYC